MPIKSEMVTIERVEYQEKEVKHIELPCKCGQDGCLSRITVFECDDATNEYNISISSTVNEFIPKQVIVDRTSLYQLAHDILEFIQEKQ